jgi:lipoyl(octanoyl) transferase
MKIVNLGADVDYEEGLRLQDEAVDRVLDGTGDETLFFLEHAPVYTIGRLRDQSSLRSREFLPYPVHEISRGGQATYHGPGQLVGYAILDLRNRNRDLHAHLRWLEDGIIEACRHFGVPADRREALTGVWVGQRKLASIGVGVRKWISLHGFALNVTQQSLPAFSAITPCGLDGVSMTSLESEAGQPIRVHDVAEFIGTQLSR